MKPSVGDEGGQGRKFYWHQRNNKQTNSNAMSTDVSIVPHASRMQVEKELSEGQGLLHMHKALIGVSEDQHGLIFF